MSIRIEYNPKRDPSGSIIADPALPLHLWNRISEAVLGVEADADILHREMHLDWATVLSVAMEIGLLKQQHRFEITYNSAALVELRKFREDVQAVKSLGAKHIAEIPIGEIDSRLESMGFTGRFLTDEQRRDTAFLIAIKNGANFSVPGAGKTTVAVAVHLLTRSPDMHLMVVAPKNAFGAWDETIDDCMDPTVLRQWRMVRLVGGAGAIRETLASAPRAMIISYDQLLRVQDLIRLFLSSRPTHLVLDESHRIKAGTLSQRGDTLLRMAHLPVRRDILSGTPITHSKGDICPQLDFLWPGQRLGSTAVTSSNLNGVIRPLYVRTTKSELHLPPIHKETVSVEMSPSQLALYVMIRKEVLSQRTEIHSRRSLRSARRSVMKLLQVSSNPILVVQKLMEPFGDSSHCGDAKLDAIVQDIIADFDSPKILKVCELARQFASDNLKTVIWTSFTRNVERIAALLSDLSAVFIHGGVDSGDADDLDTREGRIRAFHDSVKGCQVLVANPAACSEGIGLHKVCHRSVYLDRTYNAGHYVQSLDRIHRLGLPTDAETHVYILESIAPDWAGSIDYSIRRRLESKFDIMSRALDDEELQQLKFPEEEDVPLDYSVTVEDMVDLIDVLSGRSSTASAASARLS